jgi:Mlc titration factor MtfA (ptsG expression regulator)
MYLSKQKSLINQAASLLASLLIGSLYFIILSTFKNLESSLYNFLVGIGGLLCLGLYTFFTTKFRIREKYVNKEFPEKWRTVLKKYVVFYNALDEKDKKRFETNVQIFLHETRVTGVKTEVDDLTLVLTAASAQIPIFSFPDWEYDNLGEVLIYPRAFDKDLNLEGEGRRITGMVGTGSMQGLMILSKPALIGGFENARDKKNVGIHEFVHLLDGADGAFDGIPELFMQKKSIAPWLEIISKETEKIHKGTSKMNPYGATNNTEFFTVASEYFFESPQVLKKNKPELYEMLSEIYKQDPSKNKFKSVIQNMLNYHGKRISRNAPCPCGSGKKYKRCCLKNARIY